MTAAPCVHDRFSEKSAGGNVGRGEGGEATPLNRWLREPIAPLQRLVTRVNENLAVKKSVGTRESFNTVFIFLFSLLIKY